MKDFVEASPRVATHNKVGAPKHKSHWQPSAKEGHHIMSLLAVKIDNEDKLVFGV